MVTDWEMKKEGNHSYSVVAERWGMRGKREWRERRGKWKCYSVGGSMIIPYNLMNLTVVKGGADLMVHARIGLYFDRFFVFCLILYFVHSRHLLSYLHPWQDWSIFSINILQFVEICFLPLIMLSALLFIAKNLWLYTFSFLNYHYLISAFFLLQILVSCFVKTKHSEEYLRVKVRLDSVTDMN